MKRFKAQFGVAAATVLALGSLAACNGGGGGSSSQSATDTVTVALNADAAPTGYDPLLYAQGQFTFFSAMYDALFVTDKDGKAQPELVTEFSNSKDNLTTTLTLRDDVTFTDGKKLDSTVVKANLDRRSDKDLVAYGSVAPGGASEITDVAAPDPKTVVVTWKAPQATPETNLADTAGTIVGPDGIAKPDSLQTTPDGSGPFTLNSGKTTKASTYTLDKKSDARDGDKWSFDHIVFKVILDAQSLANAVISGQADVATILDPSVVELVTSKASTVKVGGTIVGFPVFDKLGKAHPAFAKPETRLALLRAIDDATIVKTLHQGSKGTKQLFPSDGAGFDAALNQTYSYDQAAAKQLLAKAGYPQGFEFQITIGGQPTEDMLAVQKQWSEIGVTMKIKSATSTDQIFAATNTEPLGFGPFSVGSNPAGFVAGVVYGGFMNMQKAKDPAIDASLGKALGSTGADQDAAVKELNAALTNGGWYIPIYEDYTYTGYNKSKVAAPAYAGTNNFLVLSSLQPVA
ncbi:ABC transporter substrate-binding protein [Cryptosporangium aurantiacum]|uniref:Peptide/nickel transport system substrate-binding protein n=1 Tax=Cryptosporangium aurantiacum TaxID=134849 RepID=A0A1M7R9X1_9ACTN|nr:ABC transporter substrate-binding protein [Cryptosporangium aurantiacum]SHN43114.1 peptide/nickel transport system substrate-binding protein [Cryptosporangium aurantiacum]